MSNHDEFWFLDLSRVCMIVGYLAILALIAWCK